MIALVALLMVLVIGMGIAFLGLAYHHHRRHHELLREKAGTEDGQRIIKG
jgi:hypothetical protein